MPRQSVLVLVATILAICLPVPGSACPWFQPTDPCGDTDQVELEHTPSEHLEPDAPDPTASEDEPEPSCEEIVERLRSPDPGVRLSILDRLCDLTSDLEECPEALAAFGLMLRYEDDAFLLHRALSIPSPGGEPYVPHLEAVADQLGHASVDVRQSAARVLRYLPLEPALQVRLLEALAREEDPWIRLTLAETVRERHPRLAEAALDRLVREEGQASAWALDALTAGDRVPARLVDALQGGPSIRHVAIRALKAQIAHPEVREVLVRLMQEGSELERIQAAKSLLQDPIAVDREAWRALVLDPRLPVGARAVLVLEASYHDAWAPVACEAKREAPALAAEVRRTLADRKQIFEVMHAFDPVFESREREGGLRPLDGAGSLRCASRPFGPPRAGGVRLPAGTEFSGSHVFTQDGVEWQGGWPGGCWVRAEAIDPDGPEVEVGPDVLEADVPLTALTGLRAALASGDLEVFDPVPGYTGIRLREATLEQRALWRTLEGRRAVLAGVEASVREREEQRRSPLSMSSRER